MVLSRSRFNISVAAICALGAICFGTAEARSGSRILVPPAADPPLPPARPPDLTPPSKAQEPPPTPPETAASDPACVRVVASDRLVATSVAPISGPEGCGIAAPVKLVAVLLKDGTHIPFEPPAIIRCALAEALGDWIRDDIAPLAETNGGLAKLIGSEGYECRPRNRVAGGKLSEHGKGDAYDLLGIALRNGKTLTIAHQSEARDFMASLKTDACARFTTVLGPGSDGFHESHLHVDLAERHNHYKICQWELK